MKFKDRDMNIFYLDLPDRYAKTKRSNLIKLIKSYAFGYMIRLTVSKFHEFLIIRNLFDNEKTPSLIGWIRKIIAFRHTTERKVRKRVISP